MIIKAWLGLTFLYCMFKPVPDGLSFQSQAYTKNNVSFLSDITYTKKNERVYEQQIFDAMLALIKEAEHFVIMDMFLYHRALTVPSNQLPLAQTLTEALVTKKKAYPDIEILVISDSINTSYGSVNSEEFDALRAAGIIVVEANMKRLRDSNPLYAMVWRSWIQWFGTGENGKLSNPVRPDKEGMTLRSWLKMLNFKANHRKVLLSEKSAIISSANPHDLSSRHSNIAFKLEGPVLHDLKASEEAVYAFSRSKHDPKNPVLQQAIVKKDLDGFVDVKLITEKKIKRQVLDLIYSLQTGDQLDMGMFYLSDQTIVRALKKAAKRGVEMRLILDPNKDAFGHQKSGVPNRPVAHVLAKRSSIAIRWYDTRGEQFHSKLLVARQAGVCTLIAGSANFTRRNINGYNLESNIVVKADHDAQVSQDVNAYFERLWTNKNGEFTLPYEAYEDRSLWKRLRWRLQEQTGLGTF